MVAFTACASANGGSGDAGTQTDAGPSNGVDASCTSCDEDGDGVPDENDQCPATPSGEEVNQVGCADSQVTAMLEPDFPPFALTWLTDGELGRPGGLTWTYTSMQRGDSFHIYWILNDDPENPSGIALDGPLDAANENWQFSAADSDLASGILVFTGAPLILLDDGTTPALNARMTVTVTDLNDVPLPVADAVTLDVTTRGGEAGLEIPETSFRARLIAEVEDPTSGMWMPYLDYFDAAATPEITEVFSSVSGSFYSE